MGGVARILTLATVWALALVLAQAAEAASHGWTVAGIVGGAGLGFVGNMLVQGIRGRDRNTEKTVGNATALDLYREALRDMKDETTNLRNTVNDVRQSMGVIEGLKVEIKGMHDVLDQFGRRIDDHGKSLDRVASSGDKGHERTNGRLDKLRAFLEQSVLHQARNAATEDRIRAELAALDSQDGS